jgi:hypothetical protein
VLIVVSYSREAWSVRCHSVIDGADSCLVAANPRLRAVTKVAYDVHPGAGIDSTG